MDETDVFFTHTIVGAPFTTLLGRQLPSGAAHAQGLNINLDTGHSGLTTAWQDWVVLSHDNDALGQPRRRPGRLRRWLERHALWLAVLGLVSLAATALCWGLLLWT